MPLLPARLDMLRGKYPDDIYPIFDEVLAADMLILATPIYCWYCTAPMKAVLDRLMYGMNKYYGEEKGPSLWAGKHVALLEAAIGRNRAVTCSKKGCAAIASILSWYMTAHSLCTTWGIRPRL